MLCSEIFEGEEEFAKWFGDSKVVDANGKPLRVYHGTTKDFEAFRTSRKPKNPDLHRFTFNRDKYIGIFFTDNPEGADFYSGFPGGGGQRTIPVYLSLQNPLIVDYEGKPKKPSDIVSFGNKAKAGGHDGLIIRNIRDTPTLKSENIYVAFASWQIKSAVGNNGNWNKFDRRITEKTVDAYHGTDKDFDEFKPNPQENINAHDSAFFHFGSNPEQANNRLTHIGNPEGSRVLPLKLNLKRSLRLPDQNEWDAFNIVDSIRKTNKSIAKAAEKLYRDEFVSGRKKRLDAFMYAVKKYRKNHGLPYTGPFNSWPQDKGEMEFRSQFNERRNEHERQLVINLLTEFGYDSIVYKNEYEGKGDSYIVFSNAQIKPKFT